MYWFNSLLVLHFITFSKHFLNFAAMCNPRAFVLLVLVLKLLLLASVSAKSNGSQWKTLTGSPPLVIARGGFSGLLPDSSEAAYDLALQTSVADVALWCDVQLTKDAVGICVPDPDLDLCSVISVVFPNQSRSYLVNGVQTTGYFSVDYTFKDLSDVHLRQGVESRSDAFDDFFQILTVDDVTKKIVQTQTAALWLNIQHDAFYRQHKLNMKSFVLSVSKKVRVSYISSPEIGFLKSIKPLVNGKRTKLVFRFLDKNDTDPSTNQTYGSLLKRLTFIKTFASGILVPKGYIWPVEAGYLQPHTSLVSDAHKVGLQVYASGFSNDDSLSFNYSYDPLAEYLQFIDNGTFSVDGVLSDNPVTPSAAIGCFSQLDTNATKRDKTLIISKFGASGDYPACTDEAYNKAISDGVDVLDCPVQMSKDGTPFCLNSIDLLESTTVAKSSFIGNSIVIPEIKSGQGIFAFNLTWTDIKGLTPSILNPSAKFKMFRNPKYMNTGTFVTLSDFLSKTKNETTLPGILITVENAAYLAEKQGLSVTNAVIDALSSAGYDKPGSQKVYLQSTDSAVLLKFKEKTNYELVYKIDKIKYDASSEAIEDIKSFADAVVINKKSVLPWDNGFLTSNTTRIVPKLQASNLSVFVETFSNEFVSQAWDFLSDSTVDINSFIQNAGIDGIVTDFPKTAARYRKNRCLNLGEKTPPYMLPVQVGSLYALISRLSMAPAQAPAPLPLLTESEVVEPPLPDVAERASAPLPRDPPVTKNAQPKVTVCYLSNAAVFVAFFLLL
ncbi:glycerophosphodiester phosphodiesterase GDPDL4-like [Vicia villosa]|uniref:glycerophosphodiester phosphodiesterase GDPDL4-like n=1 Tax=Vicia villosa TaxID=3911 RepID=UPI00273A9BE8|nr:glycerophosphodiester phosphodiesterase GDPDL4-like [Vicia villosa]